MSLLQGYKAAAGRQARERVLSAIQQWLTLKDAIPDIDHSANGMDAVLCTLAAQDFLVGLALPPKRGAPVATEGWIWVRGPEP